MSAIEKRKRISNMISAAVNEVNDLKDDRDLHSTLTKDERDKLKTAERSLKSLQKDLSTECD